jgi:hypothetical protein
MLSNRIPQGATPEANRLFRKADQHWDMAGLARQDGDMVDAERHTKLARELEAQAREAERAE